MAGQPAALGMLEISQNAGKRPRLRGCSHAGQVRL